MGATTRSRLLSRSQKALCVIEALVGKDFPDVVAYFRQNVEALVRPASCGRL